jgi:fructosamine-3-kinase
LTKDAHLGSKIAEGREAEVYAWDGTGDAAVKLYRPGYSGYVAEAAALAQLDATELAPRLIETVRIDERIGVVMERLDGVDMLAVMQRRPWHMAKMANMLAEAAVRIHRVQAPPDLPDLVNVLGERIAGADLDQRLRDFALQVLATLPSGDRLCHGDFHPGNAVVTTDGTSIIDWVGAARGAPAADFARTLLLLRQADPLPGTPFISRVMLSVGRFAFARIFARSYRNRAPQDLLHVDRWTVVNAAARLAEGISAERTRLIGIVDAAYRAHAQLTGVDSSLR